MQLQEPHHKSKRSGIYFRQKQIPTCKKHTAVPTASIFFYKRAIMPFRIYKAYKSKEKGRANLRFLFVIHSSFHTLLLSQSCNLLSANFLFQVFDKIHRCMFILASKFYNKLVGSLNFHNFHDPASSSIKARGAFI